MTSMRGGEGVTFISDLLVRRFKHSLQDTLFLKPFNDSIREERNDGSEVVYYNEQELELANDDISNWIEGLVPFNSSLRNKNIIIEIPALLNTSFPLFLLRGADEFLLVCRSNRVWSKADSNMLDLFKKTINTPPMIMLNGVRMEYMEDYLGELPKSRSWFRRRVKDLVNFNFSITDKF